MIWGQKGPRGDIKMHTYKIQMVLYTAWFIYPENIHCRSKKFNLSIGVQVLTNKERVDQTKIQSH